MTSNPPAEPRPPPPPHAVGSPSCGRDTSSAWKKAERDVVESKEDQSLDDRPAKRRKLSVDGFQLPTGKGPSTSRAKTTLIDDFRMLSNVMHGTLLEEHEPDSDEPPPLPQRPWQIVPIRQLDEEPKQTHRARSPIPVPNAPDITCIPESAPQMSNKRHAAYFPWSGKHAEDNLCADHVKQGFHDRPPNPSERETNTARVPMYNALKHRSGIESLSTLFSIVLEAKNKHGLISSASIFRPPPRVTLAEAKRRSWIADLADADVPLRKLSRTIPQGIRGQGLLDQCIQNNVPLSRAIWFAKCVGANEIRTLKRKGTTPQAAVGTESKWLREWTVNTEQFVESILTQVGQPSWKVNIQYALHLTTRLYLENLVDRDHYLDWIVKSFSASTDERLPFWLMVVHIYKQDITKFRKRGRVLAEGLVAKYSRLKDWTQGMTQTLVRKLGDAIKGIALYRSSCFLMPDQWPTIRQHLISCLNTDNAIEASILRHLDLVNERCMGSNRQSFLAKPSNKDKVVQALDATKAPYDPQSIAQALRELCPNTEDLIFCCLEWATTLFRYGSARVYLTSRLLRRWQRQGIDVDSAVLHFLASITNSTTNRDFQALKHLFSDLSRSQTFSVSKYLQWLNVRGFPHRGTVQSNSVHTASGQSVLQQKLAQDSQILMDLSTVRLSGHATNLRTALLSRAGFDEDAENDAIREVTSQLQQDLDSLAFITQLPPGRRKTTITLMSEWTWNVRSKISHWLRSFVADTVRKALSNRGESPLQHSPILSRGQFEFLRACLETLGDKAVLADVIGLCSSFSDEQLQATLVETIARHADSFSAIGALEPLQSRFCQAYMSSRGIKSTMPLYATALLDLCMVFPCKYTSVNLLQQDLIRGDRGRAMAACSPFSDGIAESLQQAEENFIEQFEGVLQSEPSMHEQTMSRLFSLLTERIEKQQGTIIGEDALFNYCQLMARLRWCRKSQGDLLLKSWLTKALAKYAATFTRNLVYSLIGTGCLTIDILVEAVTAIGRVAVVAHHGWLISPDMATDHPSAYATTTKWRAYGTRKPEEALNLLGMIVNSKTSAYERRFSTASLLKKPQMLDHLSDPGRRILARSLDSLLGLQKNSQGLILSVLRGLDVLSIRFVQACLQLQASSKAEDESSSIANALVELACEPNRDSALTNLIPTLLETAEDGVASQVRQIVEERVFEMLPKLPSSKSAEGICLDAEQLGNIRSAVDQAFELCPKASYASSKSGQKLIDALLQIVKYLGNTVSSATMPRTPTATSPTANSLPLPQSMAAHLFQPTSPVDSAIRPTSSSILEYLSLILRLLCLQRPMTPSALTYSTQPVAPKQSSDTIKILAHLTSIATHPALSSEPPTTDAATQAAAKESIDFAYDVMATYVDDLSDEGRILLGRILRDKLKDDADGRLKWLFGSINVCGSDIPGGAELGKGLLVVKRDADGGLKGKVLGEWRPKVWEVLETGGRSDADVSVGLGMFDARRT